MGTEKNIASNVAVILTSSTASYVQQRAKADHCEPIEVVERAVGELRDQRLLRGVARRLIAATTESYPWMCSIPMPEELLDVDDALIALHLIAESPEEWIEIGRPTASITLAEYALIVGRLNAAYHSAKRSAKVVVIK